MKKLILIFALFAGLSASAQVDPGYVELNTYMPTTQPESAMTELKIGFDLEPMNVVEFNLSTGFIANDEILLPSFGLDIAGDIIDNALQIGMGVGSVDPFGDKAATKVSTYLTTELDAGIRYTVGVAGFDAVKGTEGLDISNSLFFGFSYKF